MPRLPRVTGYDALRAVQRDGWVIVRQRGSHARLHHPSKPGNVLIALQAGEILAPKTLQRIITNAVLTVDQFIELL